MCDQRLSLRARHSYCIQQSSKHSSHSNNHRSDTNLISNETNTPSSSRYYVDSNVSFSDKGHGEYYKRYEHDAIPVKDSNNTNDIGDNEKNSITNSALDKLEKKVFSNISQELQTKDSSKSSLESNIKFFKTTVQEIFNNFYNSMRDYEQYKKRFQEILAKSQEESLAEMEDFIKDMIQHIMSSETSIANTSDIEGVEVKDKETNVSHVSDSTYTQSTNDRLVEAYKNDNYLTDSTLDDVRNKPVDTEEIFNIFLLGEAPCLQIKMNGRNLLSEINIKDQKHFENNAASAENLKMLAAKRLELEKYLKRQHDNQMPDREIPVKSSFAKKNIYLNEDFVHECSDAKSFMAKLCNFLCKKFRKNSFG
ncbi:hypothetical protein K1T71_001618 [Dendrolimus kikuchii]|uniref:Uncharacterized protein n=1 Tax=Dendrolimus kikuchii TaxID=765133 RepID=A0ACC1DE73_9NEOP|nr:hypothetical protein K1T71_001618 [Dendrolimus kikuchii]